jgi:hypothetical protein
MTTGATEGIRENTSDGAGCATVGTEGCGASGGTALSDASYGTSDGMAMGDSEGVDALWEHRITRDSEGIDALLELCKGTNGLHYVWERLAGDSGPMTIPSCKQQR